MVGVGELEHACGIYGDEHDVAHRAGAAVDVAEHAPDGAQLLQAHHGVLGLPLAEPEMLRELLVASLQQVCRELLPIGDDVAGGLVADLARAIPVEDV